MESETRPAPARIAASTDDPVSMFDPEEGAARRRPRLLALVLMAASALATLLLIAGLWWMARLFL